jgi:hypothetical protein
MSRSLCTKEKDTNQSFTETSMDQNLSDLLTLKN